MIEVIPYKEVRKRGLGFFVKDLGGSIKVISNGRIEDSSVIIMKISPFTEMIKVLNPHIGEELIEIKSKIKKSISDQLRSARVSSHDIID